MPTLPPNYIPNSIDMLTLNGILPYDANAYIYDKKPELPIPQAAPALKQDEFDPINKVKKTEKNGWQKFGAAFLGTLALGATAIVFRKQIGRAFSALGKNIQSIFKKP